MKRSVTKRPLAMQPQEEGGGAAKEATPDMPTPLPPAGDAIDFRSLADTLARAEEATALLRANYTTWARADVEKTQRALDAATRDPRLRRAHLDELYVMMHNIKGQGSSFSYPLVTRIGQSLCRLIAPDRDVGEPGLRIVQAHLDALKLVLEQQITGTGGELGAALARRLESLTGDGP